MGWNVNRAPWSENLESYFLLISLLLIKLGDLSSISSSDADFLCDTGHVGQCARAFVIVVIC